MTITGYKHILLVAITIDIWACVAAVYQIFFGNWADVLACALLAAAALCAAGMALHRITFPHDHPAPRYRLRRPPAHP